LVRFLQRLLRNTNRQEITMPTPERPEKRGNEPPYPHRANFAKLLDWHLNFGTRPTGSPDQPGKRWSNKEFGDAVGKHERSIRNWRTARERPADLATIERELSVITLPTARGVSTCARLTRAIS
jgi:hypothetical protein